MSVTHSNLKTHSPPFALPSGIHQVFFSGTVADGVDQPSLQLLVNGGFRDLDPPVKFSQADAGGVKQAKIPAGAQQVRWTVPNGKHLISTSITQVA